jgi:hypothetical protein
MAPAGQRNLNGTSATTHGLQSEGKVAEVSDESLDEQSKESW